MQSSLEVFSQDRERERKGARVEHGDDAERFREQGGSNSRRHQRIKKVVVAMLLRLRVGVG